MNTYIQLASLKEQNGYIFRVERYDSVSDIHSYPIEEVIAMCLNYQSTVRICDAAEQTSQGSLSTWVKVHFGLLQKQHGRCIVTQ